jgi:DNA topoisomerase I
VGKALVVVESPTKVRTIKQYLGNQYNVVATVGHIRDLPEREIGIDIEAGFKPKYRTITGKQKVITSLKKAAEGVDDIYLAPDPDREGEAIAWHTAEVLNEPGRKFHRVLFHELTKRAILDSMAHPRELDRAKFDAQQTRRILDRLVGYQISPLLWRKIKSGLSAGRVQSVSVRIICDRERAIQAFEAREFWTITADLAGDTPPPFTAKLVKKNGKKLEIPDEKTATAILSDLDQAAFVVKSIEKKNTRRTPQPPFITSKLQQEAIRKLRFTARKTMQVAQQLYEGIELGGGEPIGLITYMRTDSTRISKEAAEEAIAHVRESFGEAYAISSPREFVNKNKAQDAHEAIRPTSISNTPERVARYLEKDQLALYTLIWQRFVASQMAQAIIDRNTITIAAGAYLFTATGSRVQFPGFMALYLSVDEQLNREKEKEEENKALPDLQKEMILTLNKLSPKQHFTAPPPRFSEASLVKELEENGIGRPSTYATILSTIRDKGYVDLIKGYFHPTELGFIVNDLVVGAFPDIIDVDFTANLETDLDRIEASEIDALHILSQFYQSFQNRLEAASNGMTSMKGVGITTGIKCPVCKTHELHIKMGKNGLFLACSGYPECKYTRNYIRDDKGVIQPVERAPDASVDKQCPKCGKPMVLKEGRFGKFLACTGYPTCSHTESDQASANHQVTDIPCPEPGCTGTLSSRVSKRGKTFYGCTRYPECKFAIWDKPVPKPCLMCGAKFLVEKNTKKEGQFLSCITEGCGHREPMGDPEVPSH